MNKLSLTSFFVLLTWVALSGGCTLLFVQPDHYEPDDSFDEASSIDLGERQHRTFHVEGDDDYVKAYLSENTEYLISVKGDAHINPVVVLYDEEKYWLDCIDSPNSYHSEIFTYVPEYTGYYYLWIFEWGNDDRGTYTLSVEVNGTD
ncbi:hypothetical protein [Spirochaeta thermophila]|nr:hypothetical protein [Spirochaeta thermophila]